MLLFFFVNPVNNIDFSYYQIRFTPCFDGVTWGPLKYLGEGDGR